MRQCILFVFLISLLFIQIIISDDIICNESNVIKKELSINDTMLNFSKCINTGGPVNSNFAPIGNNFGIIADNVNGTINDNDNDNNNNNNIDQPTITINGNNNTINYNIYIINNNINNNDNNKCTKQK